MSTVCFWPKNLIANGPQIQSRIHPHQTNSQLSRSETRLHPKRHAADLGKSTRRLFNPERSQSISILCLKSARLIHSVIG